MDKYYALVCYFQDPDVLSELEKIPTDQLLDYVQHWDEGYESEISEIHMTPTPYPYEDVVDENAEYALVHNWYLGDYILYRKMSQEQFDEEDMQSNGELTELRNRYGYDVHTI